MAFNYNKLRGKIVEVFGTQDNFAKKLGISTNALSRKLNNKISLSQKEVIQWAELLGICEKDYKAYFFTIEVQNDWTIGKEYEWTNYKSLTMKSSEKSEQLRKMENLGLLENVWIFGMNLSKW